MKQELKMTMELRQENKSYESAVLAHTLTMFGGHHKACNCKKCKKEIKNGKE